MKNHFPPLELKLSVILIGLAICLYGCSSSYTVSSAGKPNSEYSYKEMNEELNGRHITIEMKDGEELSAEDIIISRDSVSWVDMNTDEKSNLGTRNIKRIAFKNHLVGGLEGLVIAPVVFVGSWGLSGFSEEGIGGSAGWEAPAALGLIGGGIGMITGAIIGHSYNYEFLSAEQIDSLQNGK